VVKGSVAPSGKGASVTGSGAIAIVRLTIAEVPSTPVSVEVLIFVLLPRLSNTFW
jgi:hypothetical protein